MSRVYHSLKQILGPRALSGEEALPLGYGRDESDLGQYLPDAVALVESAAEIEAVLALAARDRIYVTPRGLGSGKSGGALALHGGIVLSTERMRTIRVIDCDNLIAVVEPGVVTATLQEAVEAQGLFYPPDPASLEISSLGGNVAENAGGPRAFKYGVTREYVLGMRVATLGGPSLALGRRTIKGVTGLDLVGLMTGSEGTLAVISELTLKLLPKPRAVATFLGVFPDVLSATGAVAALLRGGHRPRALELMDEHVVEHLQQQGRWAVPGQRAAMLLVELDGEAEALEAELLEAAEACERHGARDTWVCTDEARRRQLWEMRRQVSTMLGEMHAHRIAEDVAVPPAALVEMLRRLDQLAVSCGVTIVCYGHAGDGNLHINIVYDDEALQPRIEPLIGEIFRLALALGGTLSGEHGIGATKRRYMHLEQSPELIALQRAIKKQFDPLGLLNPGKLLPEHI